MNKLPLLLPILLNAVACNTAAVSQVYRGDYTLGHEVNTFCPENNSRCYWLSPETDGIVRDQLKHIYRENSTGLYRPVCVVVTGEIDRTSIRTGFAADTDGLIAITRFHGGCDSGKVVTHADLQHHRWVLIQRDDMAVNPENWPLTPALDFGERLFVEGSDGCGKFNGFVQMNGKQIIFDDVEFETDQCTSAVSAHRLFSVSGSWNVSIEESGNLILENSSSTLTFQRDDWR